MGDEGAGNGGEVPGLCVFSASGTAGIAKIGEILKKHRFGTCGIFE